MEIKAILSLVLVGLFLGACADSDRAAPGAADRKETPSAAEKPGSTPEGTRGPVVIESLKQLAPASGDLPGSADPAREPATDDEPDRSALNDAEAEDEHFLSVLGNRQAKARRSGRPANVSRVNPNRVNPNRANPTRDNLPPAAKSTPSPPSTRKLATAPRRALTGLRPMGGRTNLNAVAPGAGPAMRSRVPDAYSADRRLITSLTRQRAAPSRKAKSEKRRQRPASRAKTSFKGTLDEGNAADADVLKALGGN